MEREAVVVVIAHEVITIVVHLVVRHDHISVHLVAILVVEREAQVWNLQAHRERCALIRSQGDKQSLVAEVLLLADESVTSLLRLLHFHLTIVPVDVEGDGSIILLHHLDEVLYILVEEDSLDWLHLLVIIAQDRH